MKKLTNYKELVDKRLSQSCQLIKFDENNKEEWLKLRMNGIGGSDLSAILGHSHWKNRKDIYLSKKELQPQIHSFAIDFGNYFESIMFQIFSYKYKDRYVVLDYKDTMFRNIFCPYLQASLDGVLYDLLTGQVGILEIKTTQERKKEWYDKEGNRVAPIHYFDQAIHYFNVTNVDFVIFYTAVNYENSRNDRDFEILRPRIYFRKDCLDYCKYTLLECHKFWNNHVVKNIPPNEVLTF